MRGIGKFFVNGLGHADGIVRVIEPEDVRSSGALDNAGNVLVKVFPLEPELTLVSVRLLGVIDAIEVELPDCAAVKGGFDGDAVADFPMEAFRELGARDRTLTIFDIVIPLIIGHDKFRINLAVVFDVDHELGEKIRDRRDRKRSLTNLVCRLLLEKKKKSGRQIAIKSCTTY